MFSIYQCINFRLFFHRITGRNGHSLTRAPTFHLSSRIRNLRTKASTTNILWSLSMCSRPSTTLSLRRTVVTTSTISIPTAHQALMAALTFLFRVNPSPPWYWGRTSGSEEADRTTKYTMKEQRCLSWATLSRCLRHGAVPTGIKPSLTHARTRM